ncbi:DoxX family protein [Salipaludibacillus sp. CF4.18]|uniref:DoxX family protein n=1 Tax=Salipaludibacillus sp. CF4.18 TaxID=3373081 RepID=UPI003EE5A521
MNPAHGSDKFLGGIENTAGWFDSIDILGFLAYIVATIEMVGGIALILGIGTRIISTLITYINWSHYNKGPYGVSVTVGQDGKMQEDLEEAAKYQAKRVVQVAEWIKKETNNKEKANQYLLIGFF